MDENQVLRQIAAQRARNQGLLKALAGHGVALDEPRSTDHHFHVKTSSRVKSLSAGLLRFGFENLHHHKTGALLWQSHSVEAKFTGSPNLISGDRFVEDIVRLAARHESTYDGWGTSLGRPAAPPPKA